MQYPVTITRNRHNAFESEQFRTPVLWVAVTSTDRDITLHAGFSPAEPLLFVRAGGAGTVRVATPLDALCITWDDIAQGVAGSGTVTLTVATMPLQHWRHERDAVPFSTVQDTDFFSSFDAWRVRIGAPPAAAPVGLSWPLTWTYDDADPTARASYPMGNSHAPNQPAELVPASGLYALPSAASVGGLAERIGGSAARGLDVRETRPTTFTAMVTNAGLPIVTAIGAGATVQLCYLYHLATSAARARIIAFDLLVDLTTVGGNLIYSVLRLDGTTAPSGATAITEASHRGGTSPECFAEHSPGANGSTGAARFAGGQYRIAATPAAPASAPPIADPWVSLVPPIVELGDFWTLREGVEEGFVLRLTAAAATNVSWLGRITWTEE